MMDKDLMKVLGIARNTYYKYKRELAEECLLRKNRMISAGTTTILFEYLLSDTFKPSQKSPCHALLSKPETK